MTINYGFDLIDLAWPVSIIFETDNPANPNTYLPGAQNTTWEIYSEEFLRGIPAKQGISETVKGSDSSFASHTHTQTHKHPLKLYTWNTDGSAKAWVDSLAFVNLKHTHIYSHMHSVTPHTHTFSKQVGRYVVNNTRLNDPSYAIQSIKIPLDTEGTSSNAYTYAVQNPYHLFLDSRTGLAEVGDSDTKVPETSGKNTGIGSLVVGNGVLENITTATTPDLSSESTNGIATGNIPEYKETYIWTRIS